MRRSVEQERMWKIAGRYSAVGIEMVVAVALGTGGGYWLDAWLGTAPFLLLFGLVVGIGAASRAVLRVVRMQRREGL